MKNKNIVSSIIGFSLASWLTTLLGLVVVPISTRLLAPDVLGKFNLFNSVVMISYHLFCLGLDHGYIRLYNEVSHNKRNKLWKVSVILSAVAIFLILLVINLIRDRVSEYIVGENYPLLILYLAISIFSLTIERFILIDYRVTNKPIPYTIFSLVYTIANKVIFMVPAIFGLFDYKSVLTITAIANALLIGATLIVVRMKFVSIENSKIQKTVYESFAFGWPIMLVVVIIQFMQNIPKFFLLNNFDYTRVGLYGQAVTIASVVTIAQSGFSLVWTPHVYANYKNDEGNLDKLHKYVILLITFVAAVLIIFQNNIVLLLGKDYREITHFLPILIISPVLSMLGEITGIGINIKKRTKVHILYNSLGVIITLISCYLLVPLYAEVGAAISSLIGALTIFIMRTILAKQMYTPIRSYKYIVLTTIYLLFLSFVNSSFNYNTVVTGIWSLVLSLIWVVFFKEQIIELIILVKKYTKSSNK